MVYQDYMPIGDIITITISIVYWLLLYSSYTVKQKNLRVFNSGNAVTIFAAVLHILAFRGYKFFTGAPKELIFWLMVFSYIVTLFMFIIYYNYIVNLVDFGGKNKRIMDFFVFGGFLSFSLAQVLIPITGIDEIINDDLTINISPVSPFGIGYAYFVIIIIIVIYFNRQRFITNMLLCVVRVMVISVFIVILETIMRNVSYTVFSFVLPTVAALFLYHYNAYDTETGMLDARSFDAYLKDLRGKAFSMFELHLEDITGQKIQNANIYFFHFAEKYFKSYAGFRVRDDRIVVIYEDVKNKDLEDKFPDLLEAFEKVYQEFKLDYKMIHLHGSEKIKFSEDYLRYFDFLENKSKLNSFYRSTKEDEEEFIESVYIMEQLRDIIAKHDLNDERVLVYCQPIYDTESKSYRSAEALMRLQLPEIGFVTPNRFIKLAERYECIHPLSKIILNKTCACIRQFLDDGVNIDHVSVNFSIIELRDKNFCEDIMQIIEVNGIDYSKIAIELTESRTEADYSNIKNYMTRLQRLGIKFYLDDYGTGYSNIERVIDLPLDLVKFDRSLTILSGENAESNQLVAGMAKIFSDLNYTILFEGVETTEDEQRCINMNASYLQGYKYSKPIPIEELEGYLK